LLYLRHAQPKESAIVELGLIIVIARTQGPFLFLLLGHVGNHCHHVAHLIIFIVVGVVVIS
jgi:hypothetical protein